MIEKAFETFDPELLSKALKAGEDINRTDSSGTPLIYSSLFDYTNLANGQWEEKKSRIRKFLTVAVQHGLNLDFDDEGGNFYTAVRFCCNDDLDFLKFPIDLGVNLNIINNCGQNELDSLVEDIAAEEVCDHRECARWFYNASRLLIRNGAKTSRVLSLNDTEEDRDVIHASRLYKTALEKMSPARISSLRLDYCALVLSQYYYPYEFYAHTAVFQKSINEYLQMVMDRTGRDNMWDGLLETCVELQYPDVLEYLVNTGIDVNINCYNRNYSSVSSSILYTLRHRGYLIPEDIRNRMEKILLDSGAVLFKETVPSTRNG